MPVSVEATISILASWMREEPRCLRARVAKMSKVKRKKSVE